MIIEDKRRILFLQSIISLSVFNRIDDEKRQTFYSEKICIRRIQRKCASTWDFHLQLICKRFLSGTITTNTLALIYIYQP